MTILRTRLRRIDIDFNAGNGFSIDRMNSATTALMIGIIGALTMSDMKIAALGAGLYNGDQKTRATRGLRAYWSPPGSRKVPPMKSQKNLR
jgi:hypothetical protein